MQKEIFREWQNKKPTTNVPQRLEKKPTCLLAPLYDVLHAQYNKKHNPNGPQRSTQSKGKEQAWNC